VAGYSKIYCVGGLGGFHGSDGLNPIEFQILIGDADRQWVEVHYFNKSLRPLGGVRSFVPKRPDDAHIVLDACILFYPQHFQRCPSLKAVAAKLARPGHRKDRTLDFHLEKRRIPTEWVELRREAGPLFRELNIFEADLRPNRHTRRRMKVE
jgi:hypothetical protein